MPKLTERFRAVGFDLDGTLIDTMPDLTAAANLMLGMLGARELPGATVRSFVGNGVDQLVQRALTESLGKPPAHTVQLSAALTLFKRVYRNIVFKDSKVYPGVVQTLRALSASGLELCCITNKDSEFSAPLLESAGLSGFFKFTLCADKLEDRKPGPAMLQSACSRFGISPSEMLYVGDSNIDLAAARAAGCPVVIVAYGFGKDHVGADAGTDLRPDARIENFSDLLEMSVKVEAQRGFLTLCSTGAT
jgi:phosphoglycolate phosphatase